MVLPRVSASQRVMLKHNLRRFGKAPVGDYACQLQSSSALAGSIWSVV